MFQREREGGGRDEVAGASADGEPPPAAGAAGVLCGGALPPGALPRPFQVRPGGIFGGGPVLPGGSQPQRGGAAGEGVQCRLAPPQGPQQAPPGVLDRL